MERKLNTAAIIPCLGEATRMRPLSLAQSKVFLPFCGRPVLEYTLHQLVAHDVRTIVLVAGVGDKSADRYGVWGRRYGANVLVVRRSLEFGTAGIAKDVVERTGLLRQHGDFLIVYADSILAIDFTQMLNAHRRNLQRGCLVTVATHRPVDLIPSGADRSNYGVMRLNEEGRVLRFLEKPEVKQIGPDNVASTGVFVLNKRAFGRFPRKHPLDLSRDVLQKLSAGLRSPVFGFDVGTGFRFDIGTISEFVNKQFALLRGELRVPGIRLRGVRENEPFIGGGYVCGKSMIGRGCRIAPDGALKGLNVLGRDVFVGKGATVENSIVFDHVKIGEQATISGSVVGSHCLVGDGVVLKPGTVLGDYTRVV
jgi:NDP-sugar pyrophosphorylase family protein